MTERMPDRERIEAHLSRAQRDALWEGCRDLGIAPEDWPYVPALARVAEAWATAKVYRAAREDGETKEGARIVAELRTGVPAKTIGSRLYLWSEHASAGRTS